MYVCMYACVHAFTCDACNILHTCYEAYMCGLAYVHAQRLQLLRVKTRSLVAYMSPFEQSVSTVNGWVYIHRQLRGFLSF